jgi:hypothetical protein
VTKRLNDFAGRSDKSLHTELAKLDVAWRNVRPGDGHGGSPGEGVLEHIDALESELRNRHDDRVFVAIQATPDRDVARGIWPPIVSSTDSAT